MKVLDRSWINCLRMWKWILENLPGGFSELNNNIKEFIVESLKRQWLRNNKNTKSLLNDCFFCAYDKKHGNVCDSCPARLVEKGFHCCDHSHHFTRQPIEFYHHLLELNSKRRK